MINVFPEAILTGDNKRVSLALVADNPKHLRNIYANVIYYADETLEILITTEKKNIEIKENARNVKATLQKEAHVQGSHVLHRPPT